jgi:phosphoribosylaminoimidazole (AIR) synthetase
MKNKNGLTYADTGVDIGKKVQAARARHKAARRGRRACFNCGIGMIVIVDSG